MPENPHEYYAMNAAAVATLNTVKDTKNNYRY
jgi:hypothetical protein